ncbi:unnamed protein product [Sphagnum balticum]
MATPHGANIVANDEIIAKMLQEELENVTAPEASEAAGWYFLVLGIHMTKRWQDALQSLIQSVPHVPKTNGDVPAQEVASEDHQLLLDRLSLYGLSEQRIEDQLYRTPEHHKFVRDSVVKQEQLMKTPDAYSGYFPMDYEQYMENMAKFAAYKSLLLHTYICDLDVLDLS